MLRLLIPALLLLSAAPLALPDADARHICFPGEPPWSCEHRRPDLREVLNYVCDVISPVCDTAPLGVALP